MTIKLVGHVNDTVAPLTNNLALTIWPNRLAARAKHLTGFKNLSGVRIADSSPQTRLLQSTTLALY